MRKPTRSTIGEGRRRCIKRANQPAIPSGYWRQHARHEEVRRNTGSPGGGRLGAFQLAAREGQAGPSGMAERLVVPMKPGNAGRGKGPQFRGGAESSRETAIGASLATRLMLAGRGRHPMPATAWDPVREPDAGNPHVRFDERDVETEHGSARLGTGNRKGRQRLCAPKPPRHISTLR